MSSGLSCSVTHLPPELINTICTQLEPTDVASFRLLCRSAADIGLRYLVPEAQLIIKPSSFSRLDEMSRNPVVGQNIRCLLFHCDLMSHHLDIASWEDFLVPTNLSIASWEQSLVHQTQQNRSVNRAAPCICTPNERRKPRMYGKPGFEKFEAAYGDYKRPVCERKQVAEVDYWVKDMGVVLSRMPNLKRLRTTSQQSYGTSFGFLFRRIFYIWPLLDTT